MNKFYTNSTVLWSEAEIKKREYLIENIYQILREAWTNLNRSVRFKRVETPILTTANFLQGHVESGFNLISASDDNTRFLRPEIAGGIFESFKQMYPQNPKKNLPLCLWQAGKSFREEINADTMRASKLRLNEFWQLEFELICSLDTQADYIKTGIEAIRNEFNVGEILSVHDDDLPHYSIRTLDWQIDGIEVGACSVRTDFEGYLVHEISIGLDRLLVIL